MEGVRGGSECKKVIARRVHGGGAWRVRGGGAMKN